jgi:hypothetical protein
VQFLASSELRCAHVKGYSGSSFIRVIVCIAALMPGLLQLFCSFADLPFILSVCFERANVYGAVPPR